jgi:hypothetical protein
MADILRIKRRASPGSAGAPASLANAELAYNENDHTLYIGEGTGGAGGSATVVVPIGGTGLGANTSPLMNGVAAPGTSALMSRSDHVHPSDTSRAPLDSPAFTGTPTAPTASNGTNTTQIATTAFVTTATNNVAQGLDPKASVRAATTGNITLSGTQTVDGIALIANDRCLVKNQTTPSENGLYSVQAGAWARTADADLWTELISAFVFVEEGTTQADSGWTCTVDQGGTLGTTAVTWTQFSGAGSINGGAGLVKTGNTLDVIGTAGRIVANADSIDIDAAYVGQTSITTLGTIATGTWNATTIAVNKGGTGATTLTGYVKGSGTAPLTAVASIPSTDITGLGTMAVQNANAVAITGGTIDGITFDGGTF